MSAVVSTSTPLRSPCIDVINLCEEPETLKTRSPPAVVQTPSSQKRPASSIMLPPSPDVTASGRKKRARLSLPVASPAGSPAPRPTSAPASPPANVNSDPVTSTREESPVPSPPSVPASTPSAYDNSGQEADTDIRAHAVTLFGTSNGLMSRIFSAMDLQLIGGAAATVEASSELSERCHLLLNAIVNFENVCLAGDDSASTSEMTETNGPPSDRSVESASGESGEETNDAPASAPLAGQKTKRTRRVVFCGWDGSAALPPADRVDGSDCHMASAVEALATVVGTYTGMTLADVPCLSRIVRTLREDSVALVAAVSAGSTEKEDPSRIRLAISFLLDDMATTLLRLDPSCGGSFRRLHVEKKLLEWLAQSIRFQLRSLLNPAPPRLCKEDVQYEARCNAFSQVSERIDLVSDLPKDKMSDAITEKNLATLVAQALETIFAFHGDSMHREGLPDTVSDEMTALWSRDSNADLKATLDVSSRRLLLPSQNLIESLKNYVISSARFLACRNAAQFLVDLFQLDLVRSEMSRRGGTPRMETYATLMRTYHFHDHDDERTASHAHLVLLSDVTACVDHLEAWLMRTETHASTCLDTLLDVQTVVQRWREDDGLRDLIVEKLDYIVWMPRVKVATPSIRLKIVVEGKVRVHTWN